MEIQLVYGTQCLQIMLFKSLIDFSFLAIVHISFLFGQQLLTIIPLLETKALKAYILSNYLVILQSCKHKKVAYISL